MSDRAGGVAAAIALVVIATGCAGTARTPAPEASSASSGTAGPDPTTVATSSVPPPAPARTSDAPAPAGARADIPDAVLLEQLRRRAERIARSLPSAPPPVDIDPGTNRALGYQRFLEFGFPADQWPYLDALWMRESGWNHLAENPTSGAYGIPQSLPADKMAVVGRDWRTNPDTQIQWGLAYVAARYGTAQRAWEHSQRVGWY